MLRVLEHEIESSFGIFSNQEQVSLQDIIGHAVASSKPHSLFDIVC